MVNEKVPGLFQYPIMINGRAGVGKSTVANYLVKSYGFVEMSFAEPIYELARRFFGMTEKDRSLLQQIGQGFRKIDKDVWVNYLYNDALVFDKAVVISDVRQSNEYHRGIQEGFVPIRILTNSDACIDRITIRDGVSPDVSLFTHEAEIGADGFKYLDVTNNGYVADLHRKIDDILWGLSCGRLWTNMSTDGYDG